MRNFALLRNDKTTQQYIVRKISRSTLRLLCEINLYRNLATLALHHPTLVWLGFSFLWRLLPVALLEADSARVQC